MSEKPEEMKKEAVDQAMADPKVANLNDERDNRCKPVAREILALMAAEDKLFVDTTDTEGTLNYYSDLGSKAIAILQNHDVRIGEVGYVFQMMLQATEALKKAYDTEEQHNENVLAAHKVLKILAGDQNLPMGVVKQEELDEYFKGVFEGVQEQLKVNTVNSYTIDIAQSSIQLLADRVDQTLKMYTTICTAHKWGVEKESDITVNHYDAVIKEMAEKGEGMFKQKNEKKSTGKDTKVDEDAKE